MSLTTLEKLGKAKQLLTEVEQELAADMRRLQGSGQKAACRVGILVGAVAAINKALETIE